MGYKIAILKYTELSGAEQNALLTWAGQEISLRRPGSTVFEYFENAEEKARDNVKGQFIMPITPADVFAMMGREGKVDIEISDESWEHARTRKFIPSRVVTTVDGVEKITMELHSLDDLGAQIIDVG